VIAGGLVRVAFQIVALVKAIERRLDDARVLSGLELLLEPVAFGAACYGCSVLGVMKSEAQLAQIPVRVGNGQAALDWLGANPEPALVLLEDKEKALAAGCDDFDTKPVERRGF
jgi:hypothetical protein